MTRTARPQFLPDAGMGELAATPQAGGHDGAAASRRDKGPFCDVAQEADGQVGK